MSARSRPTPEEILDSRERPANEDVPRAVKENPFAAIIDSATLEKQQFAEPKFILLGSDCGRLSGSNPAPIRLCLR